VSTYYVRVSKTKVAQVDSLLAAGCAVRAEIESVPGWMGGTKWYRTVAGRADGVIVYDAENKPVASVSYNGRVWSLDGTEVTAS
jgi:hypothetical protein